MGVEEEYLLVGADGEPVAVAGAVVATAAETAPTGSADDGGELETELKQQMLETGTRPCTDLGELVSQIRQGRARAETAAEAFDASIAAIGTFPSRVESTFTPVDRYRAIGREFALTARENLTCGCHVHVGVEDDEEGVAVLDRIAPWLPVLLAMASNSPFWQGEDSGYASYRSQVWNRWPTAGPTAPFGSAADYHRTVEELVASGAILDAGMVYFDARLSQHYPTVEIRVADVCLYPDDAALVAALCRGLVDTAAREAAAGRPSHTLRVEQLRAATWRAGRSGLADQLISPRSFRPLPAWDVVGELLDHTHDALESSHDLELVTDLLDRHRARGTGADAQRAWMAERGDSHAVVREAVRATLS
jgi:glutamate---cysteine ligase / carboxylate-amine ligase